LNSDGEWPAEGWLVELCRDLEDLASPLHPSSIGGPDGLGVFRIGLPPMPKAWAKLADSRNAIGERIAQLRRVPASAVTPAGAVAVEAPVPDVDTAAPSSSDLLENAHMSAVELADLFKVDRDALRKRLERWRASPDGKASKDWIEKDVHKSRSPAYLYQIHVGRSCADGLPKIA
jgi:hypothetical protein